MNTLLHPCSIETIYDNDDDNTGNSFLCGLYELDEKTNTRNGGITLYESNDFNQYKEIYTYNTDYGVLDMKLNGNLIASANSNGSMSIMTLNSENEKIEILDSIQNLNEGLFLSLCWDHFNCYKYDDNKIIKKIAISTQLGSVLVYTLSDNGIQIIGNYDSVHKIHDEPQPCWITCFNYHDTNVLLSGGDDCMLKFWDLRISSNMPTNIIKKFDAGVTSAQWHPKKEYYFCSGSYDEYMRIWDSRNLKEPISITHSNGGIWRVKWVYDDKHLKTNHDIITAACMHAGCKVFLFSDNDNKFEKLQEYSFKDEISGNHLAYGIDILNIYSDIKQEHKIIDENESIKINIAMCSFYDNRVFIHDCNFT